MASLITVEHTREEIIDILSRFKIQRLRRVASALAEGSKFKAKDPATSTELAFYAGRFMDLCDWEPFLKAVLERNPVSIAWSREMNLDMAYEELQTWPDESIYEGNRLALPDEVVNFKRGDGIEKALTLANVIHSRDRGAEISLKIDHQKVQLKASKQRYDFKSKKKFTKELIL